MTVRPLKRPGRPCGAWLAAWLIALGFGAAPTCGAEIGAPWLVGLARVDITPDEPLRLGGYAARTEPAEGVLDPLAVRVLAMSPPQATDDSSAVLLISVDSILVTQKLSAELAAWAERTYGIPRAQLALSSTHSHAAPHLEGGLANLFAEDLPPEQAAATSRYTRRVAEAIQRCATAALARRQPARVAIGECTATFAINRRAARLGWVSGESPLAPVDHRVRVLRVAAEDGRVVGGAFLYACHATTLTGEFRQVSADWPGLAAGGLERRYPDAVFLPIIGCGADANPEPRSAYAHAQRHAAELVDSVAHTIDRDELAPLTEFPQARFGYAGLAPEQPSPAVREERRNSANAHHRRWAAAMDDIAERMGRLPESAPLPIHTWQFGRQLVWAFLGGEVTLDYQLHLEKELPADRTWVAAYTDDVMGYVASERMRAEGGYEVDDSMIYYLQPGRWQTGTQTLIVRRVREILADDAAAGRALTPEEGLRAIRVPPGYEVQLAAAEPLVEDPINVAFGADGAAWVVEMADYPAPSDERPGGRVKRLFDRDGDGALDEAVLFLDRVSHPTSVQPWRDGALVIAAPEILFAADRDGDGYAEHREAWVTGLPTGNPQHQASGFEVGLDGWLHFAAGEGARELRSEKTGQICDVRGCDVAWNPDTGELRATAGVTQFVPARDAFGQWFGHDNTYPMYHFPIDARYARDRRWSGPRDQDLLSPAAAPPVLPRSRTVDRFNDLYTLNRFTSACSSMVVRNSGAADEVGVTGLICEPVHNLVARISIESAGSSFRATRHPDDRQFDFFTSTDPWSRPVRAVNAPDGSVWIVDMVRQVIEHPEWIPLDWQAALELGAGARSGRIYRVFRTDRPAGRLPQLGSAPAELVAALASESGAVRDLGLLAILHAEQPPQRDALVSLFRDARRAGVRVAALGCLAGGGRLQPGDVELALQDSDPRVVRYALELTEQFDLEGSLGTAWRATVDRNLGAQVDLQWVLTALQLPLEWNLAGPLATILERHPDDPWIGRAVSLVESPEAALLVANRLLETWDGRRTAAPQEFAEAQQCLAQLWRRAPVLARTAAASERLEGLADPADSTPRAGDVLLLAALAQQADQEGGYDTRGLQELASQAARRVREQLTSSSASATERAWLVQALGNGLASEQEELHTVQRLLEGELDSAVRVALIETLRRLSSAEVARLLLEAWPQLGAAERRAACATLLSRGAWVEQLVTALEQGSLTARDLDPAAAQQLRSYGDRDLRNRCERALGQPTDRSAVVAAYLAELPATGDVRAGERLFHEHCAVCHAASGAAAAIGPSLDNLGHWTLDQWVGAVLDPNQAVEPRYRQTIVLTHEGQTFAGIALEHSAAGLQLALSDGSMRTWEAAELAEVQESGLSLMPEGFETKLTPAQLADLLGYLRSRGRSAGAEGAAASERPREGRP